jgi:hypothetical protein
VQHRPRHRHHCTGTGAVGAIRPSLTSFDVTQQTSALNSISEMIDYIALTLIGQFPPVGKLLKVRQREGVTTKGYTEDTYRLFGEGPDFKAHLRENATRLDLKFSPAKLLQGHNGFGSNDLRGLVLAAVPLIFRHLSIPISGTVARQLRDGAYTLREVHIAAHHRMPRAAIPALCDAIRRTAPAPVEAVPLTRGVGIRLWPNSDTRQVLVYDKVTYFQDKYSKHLTVLQAGTEEGGWNRVSKTMDFKELLVYLDRGVRIEVRLKSRYLQRHGLGAGSAWTAARARDIYRQVLAEVPLRDAPLASELDELLVQSPPALRPALMLWARGEDLHRVYAPSTLGRIRREVLKVLGIDIGQAALPRHGGISWAALIDDVAILSPPGDLKKSLIYFDPRPSRVGSYP